MDSSLQEIVLFRHEASMGTKNKELGELILSDIQLLFRGNSGVTYALAWSNVADVKYAPPTVSVAAMKVRGLVGITDEAVIELIGSTKEENHADLARVRELVKDLKSPNRKIRSLISTKRRQIQMLQADRELAKKYHQFVEHEKILTEEEFWNSHKDRFHDYEFEVDTKRMKKGHQHVRSAIIELAKTSKKTEDGQLIINLSEDLKLKLFERYPQVRRDFDTQVPIMMVEAEFWQRYITREFFRNFEDESKFNRFVNADDAHIATGTYTGNVEGINSHIGSRPSQSSNRSGAIATSNSTSAAATTASEAAHMEARDTLEQAKKRRKFDSAHAVAANFDLTSTFGDYAREERIDAGEDLSLQNRLKAVGSSQQRDLPNIIIQQLNEEGFAAILTHEDNTEHTKRVGGYNKHHQKDNKSSDHTSSTVDTQDPFVHTAATSGGGYEDMEEVLHVLPHRPKVDESSLQLEKRLLELHQPVNFSTSQSNRVSANAGPKKSNPALMVFESALDRLQHLLALPAALSVPATSGEETAKNVSVVDLSKFLPSHTRALKSMKDETLRVQKQAMDWDQQHKSFVSDGNHHGSSQSQRVESAQEVQWQQGLLVDYTEIAELLLHYYGLHDRLRDLRSTHSHGAAGFNALEVVVVPVKSRAELAVEEKMRNILVLLERKEDALKRKKQQMQQQYNVTASSHSNASNAALAVEGVVKMFDELLAQIQRARSWGDTQRQYSEELY